MQMRVVLPQLEIYRIEREFANVSHAHANQYQVTIPLHGTCFFTHENKEMALTAGNRRFISILTRLHCRIISKNG